MIGVDEALARILEPLSPTGAETVALPDGLNRVLAQDLRARRTQPPADLSAMDGYAARGIDLTALPVTLRVIAEAPAGGGSLGRIVGPNEAVRIFTGGPVPRGADTIILQEDTERAPASNFITVRQAPAPGSHIRRAGLDFRDGETVLPRGARLGPRQIALAASADHAWLSVHGRPRIAVLSTGSELALPGASSDPSRIVSSNGAALCAYIARWGGEAHDLGIVADDPRALHTALAQAKGFDLLVTSGGASVGDYDLIRRQLPEEGFTLDFWKIAMRPGKPLLYGRLGDMPVLGLPGNPVSSLVCALLFLRPAIAKLGGAEASAAHTVEARAGHDLPANGPRQDYMRAEFFKDRDGHLTARALAVQDSSMLSALARAHGFIVRPPHAPAARAGDAISILSLDALEHA